MSINTYYDPNEIIKIGTYRGSVTQGDRGLPEEKNPDACLVGILGKSPDTTQLSFLVQGLTLGIEQISFGDNLDSVRKTYAAVGRELASAELQSNQAQAVMLSTERHFSFLIFWSEMGPSVAKTMDIYEVPVDKLTALPPLDWRDSWFHFAPPKEASREANSNPAPGGQLVASANLV